METIKRFSHIDESKIDMKSLKMFSIKCSIFENVKKMVEGNCHLIMIEIRIMGELCE